MRSVRKLWVLVISRSSRIPHSKTQSSSTTSAPTRKRTRAPQQVSSTEAKKEEDEERHVEAAVVVQSRVVIASHPLLEIRGLNSKPHINPWIAEIALGPLDPDDASSYCNYLRSSKGLLSKCFGALCLALAHTGANGFDADVEWKELLRFNHRDSSLLKLKS